MKRLLNWLSKEWWQPAVLVVLAGQIVVYGSTFGWQITATSEEWAKMGSAMSGIYGPILALLTFVVLLIQLRLQRRATLLQEQTTKHMLDQSYLQDARADVEFYLTRLAAVLAKEDAHGVAPREVLETSYGRASVEQLLGDELQMLAQRYEAKLPEIQANWMALYPIFAGMASESTYSLHHVSAIQKCIAVLSYSTCVALDNYLYSVTGARLRFRYEFSTALS